MRPLTSFIAPGVSEAGKGSIRCVNVVNFIRAVEPRGPVDLMLPVRNQMELLTRLGLPATWLLQFDALELGSFVSFLQSALPKGHEVGLWFEMNKTHCDAAGVEWRGRPGFEWDWTPSVAFTIGYTLDERARLVDTAVKKFAEVWNRSPRSVASWNLDAFTVARFAEKHGVEAFAVCRDQLATDGFTIWGAPIAGYYPSRTNCWSPALSTENQIRAPIFRMLGQDPVYYYDKRYPLEDGTYSEAPDTMEPVWPSGQSIHFVDRFFDMIANEPCCEFAYAQLGQENNFGWPDMAKGYSMQMAGLSALRRTGKVDVETLGETGRRFKRAFSTTPAHAQVQLSDPFGHTNPAERTIWYQSRFYRANLHFIGDLPFFRDITVYSDQFPQPYLNEPTREHEVEQRLPAILDGYHWGSTENRGAGYISENGNRVRLDGEPTVKALDESLLVNLPLSSGHQLILRFDEGELSFRLDHGELALSFEWDPSRSAFKRLNGNQAIYEGQGFEYSIAVKGGKCNQTPSGWSAVAVNGALAFRFGR